MSYRLLFGSSGSARSLAAKELERLQKESSCFDGLLVPLCTEKRQHVNKLLKSRWPVAWKRETSPWPVSCRNSDGDLNEDSTYRQDDFPIYGGRLTKLQEFADRQTINGWTGLIKDNRDLNKYWTFWAVLIFGSISIILALLALLVSIASLVVAIIQYNHDLQDKTS